MTVDGTILGANVDAHQATLTIMDRDGNLSEMVITPDVAVDPDNVFLEWQLQCKQVDLD